MRRFQNLWFCGDGLNGLARNRNVPTGAAIVPTQNWTLNAAQTRFVLPNMAPATVVFVSLRARNAAGWGSSSTELMVTTPAAVPSGLTPAIVLSIVDTSVSVFLPPCSTNGAAVQSYQLTVLPFAGGAPITVFSVVANLSMSSLDSATTYRVSWRARNSQGWSLPSPLTNITTLTAAPRMLSLVAANPLNSNNVFAVGNTITLTFDADTNQPNASTVLLFSSPITGAVSANWSTPRVLVLTVLSVTGSGPTLGIWSVVVAVDLLNAAQTSVSARGRVSPTLSGNWGTIGNVLFVAAGSAPLAVTQDGAGSIVVSAGVVVNVSSLGSVATFALSCTAANGRCSPQPPATLSASALATFLSTLRYIPNTLFFGPDAVSLRVVAAAGNTLASITVPVSVTPVNHAPRLTGPSTIVFPMGTTAALTGFAVTDPDVTSSYTAAWRAFAATAILSVPSSITMTVTVQTVTGFLTVNQTAGMWPVDVSAAVTSTTLVKLTGLADALGVALGCISYGSVVMASSQARDILSLTVWDNANGGAPVLSATRSVVMRVACGAVAAPTVVSAQLADSLTRVILTFSQPFVLSVLSSDALGPAFLASFKSLTATFVPCTYIFGASVSNSLMGRGASCGQTGPNIMTVFMTTGALVTVGNNLTVVPGVVRACDTSTVTASGTVVLATPANPPIPSVQLVAPASVDVCASLTVVSQVKGLGGKGCTYSWSATGSLLSGLGSLTSSATLSIPSLAMVPGTDYTITLAVTNAFGVASTPVSVTVTKSAATIPQLFIVGPSTVATTPANSVSLATVAQASKCATSTSLKLNFAWTVSPAVAVMSSVPTTSTTLTLPARSLVAGTTYTFTQTASMAYDASLSNSVAVTVSVTASPLVALLAGGGIQSVSRNSTIVLDASTSYDPDGST
jgi:hypothetical protein